MLECNYVSTTVERAKDSTTHQTYPIDSASDVSASLDLLLLGRNWCVELTNIPVHSFWYTSMGGALIRSKHGTLDFTSSCDKRSRWFWT